MNMKKLLAAFALFSLLFMATPVQAVHVNGYYKSNGTYVQPYERTAPDGNPYNNYSYPGNYNPNTGQITSGNPDTYLNDYYGGSSYSSGYTAPSTPTCPLNSYYDSISSCKCSYGYVVSGGSCVSANNLCWQQVGYSSSYDSMSNTCKCNSGYILNSSGQCTNANVVCSNQIGVMSQYNSLTNKCECMTGYTLSGSSCVYDTPASTYTASVYNAVSNCPLNSHTSSTDATKCSCDTGYQVNATKDACVITTVTSNSTRNSHGLTLQQVNAIVSLLQSFGATASVIANVQSALSN
jgi:hypothetical protein